MRTLKFIHNGKSYRIKVIKTESQSNYNHFAHLYKAGDRTPLMGWTCKESTTMDELRQIFIKSLNNYDNEMAELAQLIGRSK